MAVKVLLPTLGPLKHFCLSDFFCKKTPDSAFFTNRSFPDSFLFRGVFRDPHAARRDFQDMRLSRSRYLPASFLAAGLLSLSGCVPPPSPSAGGGAGQPSAASRASMDALLMKPVRQIRQVTSRLRAAHSVAWRGRYHGFPFRDGVSPVSGNGTPPLPVLPSSAASVVRSLPSGSPLAQKMRVQWSGPECGRADFPPDGPGHFRGCGKMMHGGSTEPCWRHGCSVLRACVVPLAPEGPAAGRDGSLVR